MKDNIYFILLGFVMVTFDRGHAHYILFSFSVNECGTPAVRPWTNATLLKKQLKINREPKKRRAINA